MAAAKTPLRTEGLIEIFSLVVLIGFVVTGVNLLRDPGVGWHLKTGEWIAFHSTVPHTDPFLFTAGKNWICNQWLSDLVLWKVYSWGSFATLQIFTFVICLLPYVLLAPRWMRCHNCSAPATALALLVAMGLGIVQWFTRPVIFSFALFAILYKLLMDETGGRRRPVHFVLFPLLFILWANLHPAFPLGLLLISLAVFHCVVEEGLLASQTRRLVALLVLSAAATVLNPRGLELHRSISGLVSSTYFMDLNTEWTSPNFHNPVFYPLIATIIICVAAPLKRPKLSVFETAAFCTFLFLALGGSRYVPFLGFAAASPLACALQGLFSLLETKQNFRVTGACLDPASCATLPVGSVTIAVSAIFLCITFFTGSFPGWSAKRTEIEQKIPAEAVKILDTAPSDSRIFNNPDWGGYLTWRLWPLQKPFIDDRNELNGADRYEDFFAIARLRPAWKSVLERYNFDYLLLEKKSPAFTMFITLPDWKLLFSDDSMGLFGKAKS